MAYGEVFIPQIAEGLLLRFGRFSSRSRISSSARADNYIVHASMTYTFDNYTNPGLQGTLAVTKNWMLQWCLGRPRHPAVERGRQDRESVPNPAVSGTTMLKDPGANPALDSAACAGPQRQRKRQRLRVLTRSIA